MLAARASFSLPDFPLRASGVGPQAHARRRPPVSATASGGALPAMVASASRASRRYASARASLTAAAGLRQARAARCSRSGSGGRHFDGMTAVLVSATQRTPPRVWPVTIRPCSAIWASWRRTVLALGPPTRPRLALWGGGAARGAGGGAAGEGQPAGPAAADTHQRVHERVQVGGQLPPQRVRLGVSAAL